MAIDADGRLIFVNTMFGCLAKQESGRRLEQTLKPVLLRGLPLNKIHHYVGLLKTARAKLVANFLNTIFAAGDVR